MDFLISKATELKLRTKHQVTEIEIVECFKNRPNRSLIDSRKEHRTDPPTQWFISETDHGRQLKLVFVHISESQIVIKTAYEPSEKEIRIYKLKLRGYNR